MNEKELIAAVKTNLDQQANALEEPIRVRLKQAREKALQKQSPATYSGFYPMSAFASVLIIIMALFYFKANIETMPPSVLEDLELLSSTEDLDLYEDLEFIEWLDSTTS